jgi:hypothetical protein
MERGCKKKKTNNKKRATNGCEAAESKANPLLNPLLAAVAGLGSSWWWGSEVR